MGIRTLLVVLLMVCTGDRSDTSRAEAEVIAQRAPEKPRRPVREKPAPKREEPERPAPKSCCKTCSKGKACGNSCISRRLTCHKPPGCACDSGGS
jgi:hypothetical protein